jgi:gluconolactonase
VLAAGRAARDVVYRSDGTPYFADGRARGVALSADERFLYVVDGAVVRHPVGDDGAVGAGDVLVPAADEIGGIEVDAAGRLYLCAPDGIRVLAPDGRHVRTLALPEAPNDLAWGDADGRTLYVTTPASVYRIRLDEETP